MRITAGVSGGQERRLPIMNEQWNSLPEEDRPYEKCERYGVQALTNRELLAVILRTGARGRSVLELAGELLKTAPEKEGFTGIRRMSLGELSSVRGIGRVKAIQILCLSELSKRLSKAEARKRLDFSAPETIAQYYMEDMRHRTREIMKLLFLNTRSRFLGENDISVGTVNTTLVSPREIFVEALKKNAVSVILLHNHPSGDPTPSKEDIMITKRVLEAGMLIGIDLLDHIIIGDNCFVSLRDKGFFD